VARQRVAQEQGRLVPLRRRVVQEQAPVVPPVGRSVPAWGQVAQAAAGLPAVPRI
jgi:hypothetical protein